MMQSVLPPVTREVQFCDKSNTRPRVHKNHRSNCYDDRLRME